MLEIVDPTEIGLASAVAALRCGALVAFPTETVYGLGAAAEDPEAVAAIYRVKGRPPGHPLIVHLATPDALEGWAEIPARARPLIEAFWPGPLTLILPRGPRALDVVTGGQSTVGVRIPAHPVARALLERFGAGVAAPSANRFGHISPTRAEHVASEFAAAGERIVLLDGGPSEVGLESTILDLTGVAPRLLRPGAVTSAAIAEVLGEPPLPPGADAPRAPGRLRYHYAPVAPALLLARAELERYANSGTDRLALLTFGPAPGTPVLLTRSLPLEANAAGRLLYAYLRELDAADPRAILIEVPPPGRAWTALRDRLERATAARSGGASEPRSISRPVPTPAAEEER